VTGSDSEGEVFTEPYARAYDALYADKDYAGECDVVEQLFRAFADSPVHSVVDLGCGTGNHALPLARRGYRVVGVDRSDAALERAEAKASGSVRFVRGDLRHVQLDERFDAALMMFAVLGYLTEALDTLAALTRARELLKDRGLLIFDVWYAPAVIEQGPSSREKRVPLGAGGELVRRATGRLEGEERAVCTVHYELEWRRDGRVVERATETHVMRSFLAEELERLLQRAGFELLRLASFPELGEPSPETWNVIAVARARSVQSTK
jgi:SAM-dependent methyltransferase